MARYKEYSYDQTKLIPLCLPAQIKPGTFEYALNHIVDHELDLTVFEHRYTNDDTGAPAFDPAILLKIVLYAYSRGITSSRDIARACEENVLFMALSADTQPHFTTIADFISSMKEEIVPLFRDIVALCYTDGLIGREMFAIDGCKISSNCSKEWSGTRAEFEKKRRKIEKSIKFLVGKHRDQDRHDKEHTAVKREKKSIERMRENIKKINTWLQENDDKRGSRGKIITSNITDNESAKMPTSHGMIQGYTGVAAVDGKHQVIVEAEAYGENQEKSLLTPTIKNINETFKEKGLSEEVCKEATVIADTGYHSNDNIEFLETNAINGYIADPQFRKRDPRYADYEEHRNQTGKTLGRHVARYFTIKNFTVTKDKKHLICPGGKILEPINTHFRNNSGLIGTMFRASKEDCRVCNLRPRCMRGKTDTPRTVTLFRHRVKGYPESFTQKMIKKFDTPEGRYIYSRRMGIIEPVFANICNTIGLNYFSVRGKVKVDIQWKLFSMVHNIGKLFRFSPRFAC